MKRFFFLFGSVEKHWWWVVLKNTIIFRKYFEKISRDMGENDLKALAVQYKQKIKAKCASQHNIKILDYIFNTF